MFRVFDFLNLYNFSKIHKVNLSPWPDSNTWIWLKWYELSGESLHKF